MITPIEVAPASGPNQTKMIRVPAGARKQVVFKLTDNDGKALDLKAEVPNPPAPEANFAPQAPAIGANVSIKLRTKAGQLYDGTSYELTGNILDQSVHRGFVEFILFDQENWAPGAYEATIGRFANDTLVDTWEVIVVAEPNAFTVIQGNGPLTIPEVRLAILDTDNLSGGSPFSNLLDDNEFTDIEIAYAMRKVIDRWNETPPLINPHTPFTFPYRHWWTVGTVGQLLLMGAARYRRNRLAYSAGGVSIDDQSKAQEYETIGQQRIQEFDAWATREKYAINIGRCWGIL